MTKGSRSRTTHLPTGWNTWDFRGFNRFVYLRRGRVVVSVQYAVWDETVPPTHPDSRQIGKLYDRFRWVDVTRLGQHAPLGLPATLELNAGGVPYRAEAREQNGALELRVKPLADTAQRLVFSFVAPQGESVNPQKRTGGMFAGCSVRLRGATWPADYFVNMAEPYAVGQPGQPATIHVTPPNAAKKRQTRARAAPSLRGAGALAEAPEAMMHVAAWNTLYDTRRKLVSTPVSRDWCFDWRGVLVFCWDTYLLGAMASYASPALARLNFETVGAAIDEFGFVPNYYMAHGAASRDRSMPPIGAHLVWKTQCAAPDRAWLRAVYPQLRCWHAFWMGHRDGNGDGLLSWGSDPVAYEFPQLVPFNGQLQYCRQAAVYESGLDNSPMYDDVPFDEHANTLALDDVGLSSYHAMDCEALANIAEALGHTRQAAGFRREHAAIAQRINELLWDEQNGIYCNRHWLRGGLKNARGDALPPPLPESEGDGGATKSEPRSVSERTPWTAGTETGRYSRRWSPTSFFPLIAGVAPRVRAERMVREHLLNEREFWGRWVIPSIARSDPAFADNDYWRGRIWGPLNFLVAEGLRRYRFDHVAEELARKGLELFMDNWRADGGVYENYNAETGRGGDVPNAARLYHWGGLLAFVAMQELIDVEPAGYLRLGSLDFPNAALYGVHVGKDVYDVVLDSGVHVRCNGRKFLDCTTRAIIRLPLTGPAGEPIEISAHDTGRLVVYAPAGRRRPARLADGSALTPIATSDPLRYVW